MQNNLTTKINEIKAWYDGYIFGNLNEIYCPWDVLNYIADHQEDENLYPEAYWKNTSSNYIIQSIINHADFDFREKIEKLVRGEPIATKLIKDITYTSLYTDEDVIWNILLYTGYLTYAKKAPKKTQLDQQKYDDFPQTLQTTHEQQLLLRFHESLAAKVQS